MTDIGKKRKEKKYQHLLNQSKQTKKYQHLFNQSKQTKKVSTLNQSTRKKYQHLLCKVDHGAHEDGVAGLVAVHPVGGIVKDPGLAMVKLESGVLTILLHPEIGFIHALRRHVLDAEGRQLRVAQRPLADQEVYVRIG